jgi:heme oxygenase (biliverdin-IX-beta and delta-forming)
VSRPGAAVQRAAAARRLVRARDRAALATLMDGRPYVSLVALACDLDASPLLFLSDLAQHTQNLRTDPAAALLVEDTGDLTDPLAGPRLTVVGHAERLDDGRALTRFAARHPASAEYAAFADFHLYRLVAERGHLVAGFGRIAWIEAADLRLAGDLSGLGAAEADILAHMNADHGAAVALYAERLCGRPGAGWRMTGIDPEGIDLRRDGDTARLDFAAPVFSPPAARRALADLARRARHVEAGR